MGKKFGVERIEGIKWNHKPIDFETEKVKLIIYMGSVRSYKCKIKQIEYIKSFYLK